MNNYQVLCFLQEDGGFYDVKGHIKLLKNKFSNVELEDDDIKNLRNIITRSTSIVFEKKWTKRSMKLRVVYVDPIYAKYSKAAIGFGRKRAIPRWTYLEGEPAETINAIRIRQQFDGLLKSARNHSNH
ncbi:hypothetical protein MF265_16805 [Serratia marcescens]|uniref:hypothetical protein n=1 Tax=Serratia marcescens TaxID=615 RepID=UPI001EF0C785|nr:hypothetical protein [Serratia marcescens]ULH09622.1 hypothetical protein MF265_16805 [Serratia marcescens]